MSDAQEIAARKLRDAYSGKTLPPMRDTLDPIDVDGAYAIQSINTRFWEEQGRRIVGRKIGLTAKAVQAQLGVGQPDFGVLFDDMEIADGGVLEQSKVIQPKAEAEIALILGKDLPAREITRDELADCVAEAMAAIEIVDSRIADWKITFADTVADNGSSAMFVLGNERKALPGLDLWTCGMVLEVNGETVSLGAGAACLGHPLIAATWLANTLTERGEPLRAGDILLTGALGPMVALVPGDKVKATVGGLGSASFSYGAE
ncbi:2-keto-4-pentenoate hydratase [Parasphingopyxis lamellibrachiae]|uniref:2-keto-4-pentenoate hydratase n=1 Tax=Parasphingopyxis lamellibrachiae TaxID=680125 RepID=A0A3D9F8S6_9SPHN|nr:fumarylacetoacetate hydrolase family protein [Parasphingopyxis lamellibrachiae]RED13369.1 2-keto-4-pentenoate hydratase [Parasphingopyxis lamellibrachiae]